MNWLKRAYQWGPPKDEGWHHETIQWEPEEDFSSTGENISPVEDILNDVSELSEENIKDIVGQSYALIMDQAENMFNMGMLVEDIADRLTKELIGALGLNVEKETLSWANLWSEIFFAIRERFPEKVKEGLKSGEEWGEIDI